jgi:hypothetical protein
VLFVLNGIETEVKLGQQVQSLNELQLQHLHNVVERQVKETQRFYVLEANQVTDVILWQIKLFQGAQVAQSCDSLDLVLR